MYYYIIINGDLFSSIQSLIFFTITVYYIVYLNNAYGEDPSFSHLSPSGLGFESSWWSHLQERNRWVLMMWDSIPNHLVLSFSTCPLQFAQQYQKWLVIWSIQGNMGRFTLRWDSVLSAACMRLLLCHTSKLWKMCGSFSEMDKRNFYNVK